VRMWMVPPEILCRKHLLGEHVEIHMFLAHLNKKKGIQGFLKNNCLEPRSIFQRHEDLAKELTNRGYNHNSPIKEEDLKIVSELPLECQYWKINIEENLNNLLKRCSICRTRYNLRTKYD